MPWPWILGAIIGAGAKWAYDEWFKEDKKTPTKNTPHPPRKNSICSMVLVERVKQNCAMF